MTRRKIRYLSHAPSWTPDVHHGRQLGGGAMIGVAELVALPFLLAVVVRWARAERAGTAALDLRLDTELVPAAPAATGPDLVRPWWETENGEVARRIRQQRPGSWPTQAE